MGVERVLRNKTLRTSSGPEGSSDKWVFLCAAEKPLPYPARLTKDNFLMLGGLLMYTALYRNFRPETFSQLIGQAPIVKILQNQINTGKTSHAYLFCGTRGTGKTSTARILAKGVNCLSEQRDKPCGTCENCISIKNGAFMDVIEIDAASNNGVDNIRELRESVKYPPQIGKCKVYIIDEVHMLSTGAFNALLKTLEEPPEKVIFILATTEPQKLPATIMSRCLRLDFKRISEMEMIESMTRICKEIGVTADASALALIAVNSDGSVRDCLSILDQCIAHGGDFVNRDNVVEILGTAGEAVFIELTDYVNARETAKALALIEKLMASGKDTKQFIKDWILHLRNLLMTKYLTDKGDVINLSFENIERISKQGQDITVEFIHSGIILLSSTLNDARWSSQPRTLLELAIIKLSEPELDTSIESLLVRISKLEAEIMRFKTKANSNSNIASDNSNIASDNSNIANDKPNIVSEDISMFTEINDEEAKLYSKILPKAGKEIVPVETMSKGQLEAEWAKIIEACEKEKGSFGILRNVTKMVGIDDTTIFVETKSGPAEDLMQRGKDAIRKIIEEVMGKPYRVVCNCSLEEKTTNKSNAISAEELAEQVSRKFGIEVEIE